MEASGRSSKLLQKKKKKKNRRAFISGNDELLCPVHGASNSTHAPAGDVKLRARARVHRTHTREVQEVERGCEDITRSIRSRATTFALGSRTYSHSSRCSYLNSIPNSFAGDSGYTVRDLNVLYTPPPPAIYVYICVCVYIYYVGTHSMLRALGTVRESSTVYSAVFTFSLLVAFKIEKRVLVSMAFFETNSWNFTRITEQFLL